MEVEFLCSRILDNWDLFIQQIENETIHIKQKHRKIEVVELVKKIMEKF